MLLTFLNKHRNIGLLILRLGLGAMFIYHGAPKLFAGPAQWGKIGMAMATTGITFAPTFWGFMAAVAEFAGGICIMLGLFFRYACVLLVINLSVATTMHLTKGDGLQVASHAIEDGIVFLSLIFIGAGKYSVDEKLQPFEK